MMTMKTRPAKPEERPNQKGDRKNHAFACAIVCACECVHVLACCSCFHVSEEHIANALSRQLKIAVR